MQALLEKLVQDFESNPLLAGQALRKLWNANPDGCRRAVLGALKGMPEGKGADYLTTLLARDGFLLDCLWDPNLLELDAAVVLGKRAGRVEPQLALKLARRLSAAGRDVPEELAERALKILVATANDGLVPLLLQSSRHSTSKRIRSKITLLTGRVNRNARWVEEQMSDLDPRARANALESIWDVHKQEACDLLRKYAGDPHNRVAGNALLGLYLLGQPDCIPKLFGMAAHRAPEFRATAAWVMGKCEAPRFLPALERLATDPAERVAPNATQAIARIRDSVEVALAAGRLKVRGVSPGPRRDGWRELRVVVSGPQGDTLPGIPPTRFAIWEDSEPVLEYTVEELTHPGPLAVGFALPHMSSGAPWFAVAGAVAARMTNMRTGDQWAAASYRIPTPGREECDPDELERAQPPGIRKTFRSLLVSLGPHPGARHLMVLCPPHPDPYISQESVADLASRLWGSNVSVHIFGAPGSDLALFGDLGEIARRTGGHAVWADAVDKLAGLMITHYMSLYHCYRLLYRPPDPDGKDLHRAIVCVQTPSGLGEWRADTDC